MYVNQRDEYRMISERASAKKYSLWMGGGGKKRHALIRIWRFFNG